MTSAVSQEINFLADDYQDLRITAISSRGDVLRNATQRQIAPTDGVYFHILRKS